MENNGAVYKGSEGKNGDKRKHEAGNSANTQVLNEVKTLDPLSEYRSIHRDRYQKRIEAERKEQEQHMEFLQEQHTEFLQQQQLDYEYAKKLQEEYLKADNRVTATNDDARQPEVGGDISQDSGESSTLEIPAFEPQSYDVAPLRTGYRERLIDNSPALQILAYDPAERLLPENATEAPNPRPSHFRRLINRLLCRGISCWHFLFIVIVTISTLLCFSIIFFFWLRFRHD